MSQITNPLTGKSYTVSSPTPAVAPELSDKTLPLADESHSARKPLITYTAIIGGSAIVLFVLVSAVSAPARQPSYRDRLLTEEMAELPANSIRDADEPSSKKARRAAKKSRQKEQAKAKKRGRAAAPVAALDAREGGDEAGAAEGYNGIFAGFFCRGARRSASCD